MKLVSKMSLKLECNISEFDLSQFDLTILFYYDDSYEQYVNSINNINAPSQNSKNIFFHLVNNYSDMFLIIEVYIKEHLECNIFKNVIEASSKVV